MPNIPDIILAQVQSQLMGIDLGTGPKVPVANDQTLVWTGQKACMDQGMASRSAFRHRPPTLRDGCGGIGSRCRCRARRLCLQQESCGSKQDSQRDCFHHFIFVYQECAGEIDCEY
jgi:hypothetical protein